MVFSNITDLALLILIYKLNIWLLEQCFQGLSTAQKKATPQQRCIWWRSTERTRRQGHIKYILENTTTDLKIAITND